MGAFSIWHWLIVFALFFLPAVLAASMARRRKRSVVLWVVLAIPFGWVTILVLAIIGEEKRARDDQYAELERAKKLLDQGVLTDDEFTKEKARILGD